MSTASVWYGFSNGSSAPAFHVQGAVIFGSCADFPDKGLQVLRPATPKSNKEDYL